MQKRALIVLAAALCPLFAHSANLAGHYFVESGQTRIQPVAVLEKPPTFLKDASTLKKVTAEGRRVLSAKEETFVFKEAGKVTLLKDMPEMYLATYEPQPPGRPAVTCRISEIGGVKACDTEQVFFNAMSIYVDLDSDGVKEEIYQINPEFGFEFWVRRLNRENLEFKDSFRFLPVVQLEKENGVAKFELSDLAGTDLVVDYSKVGTRIRALPFHCFTEFSTTFSLLEAMFFPLVEFKRHVRAESKNTKFSGPELQWVSLADLEKVPAAYKAAATCTKDADCVLTKYTDGALVSNRSFKVPTYCKDDPTWTSFEEFNRLQQYDAFRQPPPRCDKKHKTCD